MEKIDARGLNCPAPVLQTRATIEESSCDMIRVIVDNEAARQNVCRFLESQSYETTVKEEGEDFHITGKKKNDASSETTKDQAPKTGQNRILVMISADCIGKGDDTLGSKLMINFLKTLNEMGNDLWRLIFLNAGVKLIVEGAESLPILKRLEEEGGVTILVCGTCLSYFNLLDKKQVGETTNMLDIITAMQLADKVINL